MQYETIILELLSRIKKLEDEVSELKRTLDAQKTEPVFTVHNGNKAEPMSRESTVTYKKMTDDMIDICYQYGKKVADGKNAQDLAGDIAKATGMNRNSAVMYLYAVQGMLNGDIYKRSISATAIKKYFDTIFSEFGREGLRKAIYATRLHVDYRRSCGHMVDSIEEICNQYERKL
jgi:hypothetical protein